MVAIAIWAGLLAWAARTAQARGRSVLVWTLGTAAVGGVAFAIGVQVMLRAFDEDASVGVTLAATMMPLAFMLSAMVGLVVLLLRQPIHVSLGKLVRVHFVDRGEGTLQLGDGKAVFAWTGGTREAVVRELAAADADGECVRIRFADGDELCFMPMGKPDSPAGRREQSVHLARLLRG